MKPNGESSWKPGRLVLTAVLLLWATAVGAAAQATCTKDDLAAAVDRAGATLRAFNAEAIPKLKEKLKLLKAKKGWSDAGYEAQAVDYLQDKRIAEFDEQANDLLSTIDDLGRTEDARAPDCRKVSELDAAATKLLSVMKAKSEYTLSKIDRELVPEISVAMKADKPKSAPKPSTHPPAAPTPAPTSPARDRWDTTTNETPPERLPPPSVPLPPPDIFVTDEQGYTIEEIQEASRGLFGTVSTSLASVIEHAFSTVGRPTAYVLGSEGGGAFLAGLRYGQGTLYLRNGGTQKVYWHGPSIGGDIGAEGAQTLYLIYRLKEPNALFRRFAGIDGTAYLVGGVGMTLLKGGDVVMAPIRSGIGLRLGASLGYVRFTPRPTWNPF
jgi:hypothetical protein